MKPEKLPLQSADGAQINLDMLYQIAPSCFTEARDADGKVRGVVNFDVLRQLLGDAAADTSEEFYQFTWPGKAEARREAARPIRKTLRPVPEDSVDWDTTHNLYIEGDNLEVLKLLQKAYMNKVKMIYIDPPYNTGNDFVYNDDFAASASEYDRTEGNTDELGNRYRRNSDSNGRFHSDWCSMIYPRLKVARDLLTEDGVVFISIDDHEYGNLHKLCCEIFGQRNVIGSIIIQSNPRGSMSSAEIAELHEYVILCAKNRDKSAIIGHKLTDEMLSEYKYTDIKGRYRLLGLRMRGGFWRRSDRPKLYYPIYINPNTKRVSIKHDERFTIPVYPIQITTGEEGTWRWSKEKISLDNDNLIGKQVSRESQLVWDVFQKDYLEKEGTRRTKAKSIWNEPDMNYQNGTNDIKVLLGNSKLFDYSKPTFLINQMLEMVDTKGSIILDFFSGSATTAHAVMKLNAEDGGHRKFIMVQLPEVTDEKSEARKAGYETICQIGEERIRRAGKKVKEEAGLQGQDLDIGFRVFRVDESNMEDVYFQPTALHQEDLNTLFDNVKPDRNDLDLLFGAMLDWGVKLSLPMSKASIDSCDVYTVNDGDLVACFAENITENVIAHIANQSPLRVLFRDSCFNTDADKINIFEQFKQRLGWSNEEAMKNIRVI